jgi:hypothetical protein
LLAWAKISFTFNKCCFRYHVNMFPFMCGCKGRRLVINSFYHTYILFIFIPLPYNTTHPSWLATSYNCPFFTVLVSSYHWWSRYPFTSMLMWEWSYYRPQYTSTYYCSDCLKQWNTYSQGGSSTFSLATPDDEWISLSPKKLSNLDGCCHCWLDLHIYGAANINDNHTCNDDGYSGKDTIISWMNTKRWLHSHCYWSYGCFHSCFDSFMTACA